MLHEEKEDNNDGTDEDMEVKSTVQEEKYEDDTDYTERFTLRMEAGWNPMGERLWRGSHE